jgi:uncharacterized repeat protein (TIGR02543 family)
MYKKVLFLALAFVTVGVFVYFIAFFQSSFTVTFRNEDNSILHQVEVKKGEDATPPDNPTKVGYTFSGWDAEYRNIVADVTINATYAINSYTISFNVDGGSDVTQITQHYQSLVTAPADPTKPGYTFGGWLTEANGTTAYLFTTMPAGNSTAYAKWTINQIAIAFETNGGTIVEALAQDYNTAVAAPMPPAKVGHTFGGWYSDEALTTLYVFSTMPAQSITLYAKWTIIAYTVTFEDHDGTVLKTESVNYGFNATAPANPTRVGYTFFEWSASFADVTANLTVTATYAINLYTIAFQSNGGTAVAPLMQNYGTAVSAPVQPTFENMVFLGWFAEPALTTSYVFTTMPAQNITLYAKWTIVQYTVTFEDYDGSVITTQSVDHGSDALAPNSNPTRTGYTFQSWNVPYADITANLTVTATYTINSYSIHFDANGGSAVNTIVQNYATAVVAPAAPTRTGYMFDGWYLDDQWTTPYVFSTIAAENIDLIAKWTINLVTLSFDSDGGTAVTALVQNYDTPIAAPTAPTKVGHTFDGWYVEPALTTSAVFSTMPAQNTTFYAKWVINQYTVTFQDYNESVLKTQTVNYGSAATAPNNPTRPNYTFGGWDVGYTNVTGDLTVTATYTINQYTITFQTNGGSAIPAITQDFGSVVNAPADPTRNTDTFGGWFSDAGLTTAYVFTTIPNQNITVYAKWYSGGLSYTLIDGGTHYSVSRGTASGHILIPSLYNGLPVTAIAANGFDRFGQSWTFTSLTLSEGLTTIGADAFRSYPLTTITFPSTLVSIGNTAFAFCGLTSIHLPVGVTGISEQMFSSCSSLQTITVDGDNPNLTSLDGVLFNDDMTTLIAYPNANARTSYTVPASVTTVAAYAFRQFSNLQHLIFQTGLTTFNQYSITSSSALLTVYIPLSVTAIGYNAIWSCSNLTIRAAAAEKPIGWNASWNGSNRPVIWSYVE